LRGVLVIALAASLFAACDSGDGTPRATVRVDGSGSPEMASVGKVALEKCGDDHARVRVAVEFPHRRVEATVNCDELRRTGPSGVATALLASSADVNDSATKAARVIAIQHALPWTTTPPPYDHDLLAWGLVRGDGSCRSNNDLAWVRKNIPDGMQHGETVGDWTRIEAVLIAGVCPDRLQDLYGNVAAAGYPGVARAVRAEIEHAAKAAGVPLDTTASPS
jgi:hypothetical protein